MTVCAVVVTYNRLNLLKECIQSLRNQTRKLDKILIINNSSNDGTLEWLSTQKDLTVITQPNSGGAGGFHTGIKTAYENGHDWIWCMDDDCLTQKEALIKLMIPQYEQYLVRNSLVLSIDNYRELAFGLYSTNPLKFKESVGSLCQPFYLNSANMFNGTLINKKVIEAVGYPNPIYFFQGDEVDFMIRLKNKKIEYITVVSSHIFHPKQKFTLFCFGNKVVKFTTTTGWKKTIEIRNKIILYRYYSNKRLYKLLIIIAMEALFCFWKNKKIKSIYDVALGLYRGVSFKK